jgi:hypothetical protein
LIFFNLDACCSAWIITLLLNLSFIPVCFMHQTILQLDEQYLFKL